MDMLIYFSLLLNEIILRLTPMWTKKNKAMQLRFFPASIWIMLWSKLHILSRIKKTGMNRSFISTFWAVSAIFLSSLCVYDCAYASIIIMFVWYVCDKIIHVCAWEREREKVAVIDCVQKDILYADILLWVIYIWVVQQRLLDKSKYH